MSTNNILDETALEPTPAPTPSAGGRSRRWRLPGSLRLRIGLGIVAFFILLAVVGPFFAADPNSFHAAILQGPSARFPLGTTNTGQDVFAQLIDGSRGTLEVGFLAAAVSTLISIMVGIGGGYLGGRTDEGLSLLSNVVLVIPALPLIILVSAYVHSKSLLPLILVIALTSWAASARVLRAQTLSVRQRDYVLAVRASGEKSWRIVLVEILPNELPIITAQFLFGVIFAILTAAGLAFLGLGNISSITWGSMLYYAQNDDALTLGAWWWFVPPGLCIAILGAGLSLANFGLDEVSNPRLRVRSGRRAR
jgi:peptide/nickel transport system permease protein